LISDFNNKSHTRPGDVSALAAKQNGLVCARQLRALGLYPATIAGWARMGRLHTVHRGVYAVGHGALSPEARLHAAALALGPDAAISHRSAAALWGFLEVDGRRWTRPVDVTIRRRARRRPGIRPHYNPMLAARDVTHLRAVPTTTPVRTLIDLAGLLPPDVLRRAVRQAEVLRLVDHRLLVGELRRARGRRGTAALARILEVGPAPTRSELEDRMLELLLRNGFPRPLVNARPEGVARAVEVDFLFEDLRLVLETDGDRYHGTRLAREADAARQADLEAAGYRVVRFTWRQVTEHEAQTVKRLRAAIRRRGE
jgi:very-short-patch-repair endonuclease